MAFEQHSDLVGHCLHSPAPSILLCCASVAHWYDRHPPHFFPLHSTSTRRCSTHVPRPARSVCQPLAAARPHASNRMMFQPIPSVPWAGPGFLFAHWWHLPVLESLGTPNHPRSLPPPLALFRAAPPLCFAPLRAPPLVLWNRSSWSTTNPYCFHAGPCAAPSPDPTTRVASLQRLALDLIPCVPSPHGQASLLLLAQHMAPPPPLPSLDARPPWPATQLALLCWQASAAPAFSCTPPGHTELA